MKDSAWVEKILQGDKMAGERFVAEHYPRIYRLLRHLTGNVEVAEDLTQQTFVKAWKALATFKNQSLLITWLHRIAYHEYTHWLRDRRQHASLDSLGDLPSPHSAPDLETLALPGALAQLSPDHRITFILHYVQDLSVSEVAQVLDTPPGTVKSRLSAARHRLRELLEEPAPAPQTETEPPYQPTQIRRERLAERAETVASWQPKETLSDELPASRIQRKSL